MINKRKSIFVKKSLRYFYNLNRFLIKKKNQSRIILCNSFPKSGTHLLFQILEFLPHRDWFNFIASIPSIPFREKSSEEILKSISNLVDRELVGAHLFYSNQIDKFINRKNISHYFIYRDPRDVVISEAFYLSEMNRWHAISKYYRKLNSLEDQIEFAILGNEFLRTKYDYPNITQRFSRYKGWLKNSNVFSIKYENLIGERKIDNIKDIITFYNNHNNDVLDVDLFSEKIIKNLDPKKSHTFREGGSNKWKKYFTNKNKNTFKQVGGNLLVELGYENDFEW